MIDLIPGHGWLDLAGVVIMVLAAFGVFFVGLAATDQCSGRRLTCDAIRNRLSSEVVEAKGTARQVTPCRSAQTSETA